MCSITFFLFLCSEQVYGETGSNGKFKFTFFVVVYDRKLHFVNT